MFALLPRALALSSALSAKRMGWGGETRPFLMDYTQFTFDGLRPAVAVVLILAAWAGVEATIAACRAILNVFNDDNDDEEADQEDNDDPKERD